MIQTMNELFNTLRKTLPVACAVVMLAGCSGPGGFSDAEQAIITRGTGDIMRVLTIADRSDSLFLREKSAPISREALESADYAALRHRMLATVQDPQNTGVGIAAPQVGIRRQLIAVQRFDKTGEPFEFYLNPQIVKYSEATAAGREGCLSIPERYGTVVRAQEIVVRYRDERFQERTDTIGGFTAVIFQHETDHLNGILYTDRMVRK